MTAPAAAASPSARRAAPPSALPVGAPLSPTARRVAGVIAGLGWVALALQLIVTVTMMTGDGASLAAAVWRYLGYFTILTNLLVAVTMTRVARGHGPGVPAITGVVLAIAIVCVTYDLLLRDIVPAMGPVWWTADRMLHYVVPIASVLWWLLLVPKHALGPRHPPGWLLFPIGYLLYALARGAVDGWYPYFFIDAGALGYPRALLNALALSVAMLLAGYAVVALARLAVSRSRQ